MRILETERLALRLMSLDDAEFMLGLMNEPSWLEYIGDRGVRTLDHAVAYIANGPLASYEQRGFGFYIVELRDSRTPIGMCGLVKRNYLDDIDLGYALLPRYWGHGYAYEAAKAVLDYAIEHLGLKRIVAITSSRNHASGKLLFKLGLRFERMVTYPDLDEQVQLFAFEPGRHQEVAGLRHFRTPSN